MMGLVKYKINPIHIMISQAENSRLLLVSSMAYLLLVCPCQKNKYKFPFQ